MYICRGVSILNISGRLYDRVLINRVPEEVKGEKWMGDDDLGVVGNMSIRY